MVTHDGGLEVLQVWSAHTHSSIILFIASSLCSAQTSTNITFLNPSPNSLTCPPTSSPTPLLLSLRLDEPLLLQQVPRTPSSSFPPHLPSLRRQMIAPTFSALFPSSAPPLPRDPCAAASPPPASHASRRSHPLSRFLPNPSLRVLKGWWQCFGCEGSFQPGSLPPRIRPRWHLEGGCKGEGEACGGGAGGIWWTLLALRRSPKSSSLPPLPPRLAFPNHRTCLSCSQVPTQDGPSAFSNPQYQRHLLQLILKLISQLTKFPTTPTSSQLRLWT